MGTKKKKSLLITSSLVRAKPPCFNHPVNIKPIVFTMLLSISTFSEDQPLASFKQIGFPPMETAIYYNSKSFNDLSPNYNYMCVSMLPPTQASNLHVTNYN